MPVLRGNERTPVPLFFYGSNNGKIVSAHYFPLLSDICSYGYLGVCTFFMISGWVIFCSAKHHSPMSFALSRAVRLYPCYCFAVLFTSISSILLGGKIFAVTVAQIFANLTMIAPVFGHDFVDGVYWALIVELKFYFLVFALLLFGAQKKMEIFFFLWPVIMLCARAVGLDELPFLGGTILSLRPAPHLPSQSGN